MEATFYNYDGEKGRIEFIKRGKSVVVHTKPAKWFIQTYRYLEQYLGVSAYGIKMFESGNIDAHKLLLEALEYCSVANGRLTLFEEVQKFANVYALNNVNDRQLAFKELTNLSKEIAQAVVWAAIANRKFLEIKNYVPTQEDLAVWRQEFPYDKPIWVYQNGERFNIITKEGTQGFFFSNKEDQHAEAMNAAHSLTCNGNITVTENAFDCDSDGRHLWAIGYHSRNVCSLCGAKWKSHERDVNPPEHIHSYY